MRRLVPIFYGNLRPADAQPFGYYILCYTINYFIVLYVTKDTNKKQKNTTMVEPVAGL